MCILKKIKMDSFEVNKIIAAILVTVLLVFGISKISDIITVDVKSFSKITSPSYDLGFKKDDLVKKSIESKNIFFCVK